MSVQSEPRLTVLCPIVTLATVVFLVAAVWITPGCARSSGSGEPRPDAAAPHVEADRPRLLDDVAGVHLPVTTRSPRAQRFVDQGLYMAYAFNHDAAARAFREAARLDPDCAMCFWGEALVLGPNINAPMGPAAARRARAAVLEARARMDAATPRERAYIEALTLRYADDPQSVERAALDRAYAEAMRQVQRDHPEDLEAAVLTAEAIMDTMPWDYWASADTPRESTPELLALLEKVLTRRPDHVGANHYMIHTVEEYHPERAVAAAERLVAAQPEAGHLVHMPSHIFWRVGRYQEALDINVRAAEADEAFFAWCRAGTFYRAAYYPHNLHFLWAAAAAEGRGDLALATARRLEAATRDRVESFPFLEEFLAIPVLTLARFGRWDAILGLAPPDSRRPYLSGIHAYARGLARVRMGDLPAAAQELAVLRGLAATEAARALSLAGGTASAAGLLAIGEAHLAGELLAARGEVEAAVTALERGVARQDRLRYMEPPPWYAPVRQALGAVLLDADRPEQAEEVYRADLEAYPRNGWSLYGLARSLEAQGRASEAQWAQRGFQAAWARADVELEASRF